MNFPFGVRKERSIERGLSMVVADPLMMWITSSPKDGEDEDEDGVGQDAELTHCSSPSTTEAVHNAASQDDGEKCVVETSPDLENQPKVRSLTASKSLDYSVKYLSPSKSLDELDKDGHAVLTRGQSQDSALLSPHWSSRSEVKQKRHSGIRRSRSPQFEVGHTPPVNMNRGKRRSLEYDRSTILYPADKSGKKSPQRKRSRSPQSNMVSNFFSGIRRAISPQPESNKPQGVTVDRGNIASQDNKEAVMKRTSLNLDLQSKSLQEDELGVLGPKAKPSRPVSMSFVSNTNQYIPSGVSSAGSHVQPMQISPTDIILYTPSTTNQDQSAYLPLEEQLVLPGEVSWSTNYAHSARSRDSIIYELPEMINSPSVLRRNSLHLEIGTSGVVNKKRLVRQDRGDLELCGNPHCPKSILNRTKKAGGVPADTSDQVTGLDTTLPLCDDCEDAANSESQNGESSPQDGGKLASSSLIRNTSTRSLPGIGTGHSASEDEDEDAGDSHHGEAEDEGEDEDTPDSGAIPRKDSKGLRRKRVLKRRCHTDEKGGRRWTAAYRQSMASSQSAPDVEGSETTMHSASNSSETDVERTGLPEVLLSPSTLEGSLHDAVFDNQVSPTSSSYCGSPPLERGLLERLSPGSLRARKDSSDTYSTYSHRSFHSDHGSPMINSRNASFSSNDREHDRNSINFDAYTPEELKYTRLKRISATTQSDRRNDRSRPRDIVNKRLHLNGTNSSRKASMPVRPKSADKDSIRKYSLSTECFTLLFDFIDPQSGDSVDIVAASKGVQLQDAIKRSLERRGLRSDAVRVFLASSHTALPLESDSLFLGGNQLHVQLAKETESPMMRTATLSKAGSMSNIPSKVKSASQRERERLEKKQLGSQRGKKNLQPPDDANLSDTSPHGTWTPSDISKFKAKFFGQAKAGQNDQQLVDVLNGYSQNGLPTIPPFLRLGKQVFSEQDLSLEDRWTDIVDNAESLSRKECDRQERIWEILRTEVEYIKKLQVIDDVFRACLLDIQNEGMLNEIDLEKVFSNITDLYQANGHFWTEYMSQVVKESRRTREPLNPSLMKEGFFKFQELFQPYRKYFLEQELCREYKRKKTAEFELFKTFMEWAETHERCNRLPWNALVVAPMHRITRYKLLLLAILKSTQDTQQRKDLAAMIEHVERFVHELNTAMHQKQEQERLSAIISRIDTYHAIDSLNEECAKLVNEFATLDLTCRIPGCGPQQKRHLLKDGPLKLKDTSVRVEVILFLFTDMLLVTKLKDRRTEKVKVIKPPMRLDKIKVHALRDGASFLVIYLNEYHVATAMYTFHGDATKVWVEEITKAQDTYRLLRQQALENSGQETSYLDCFREDEDYAVGLENSYFRTDSNSSVDSYMPVLGQAGLTLPRSGAINHERAERVRRTLSHGNDHERSPLVATVSLDDEPNALQRSQSAQTITYSHEKAKSMSEIVSGDNIAYNMTPDTIGGYSGKGMSVSMIESPYSDPPVNLNKQLYLRSQSNPAQEAMPASAPVVPGAEVPVEDWRRPGNQRRGSRDQKRYYTADAIQDMTKDNKDKSIHKRLSLNMPPGPVHTMDEHRQGILKNKTWSSDSLRSMHSSSGVSSTASLHLSPDSEICEENESEATSLSSVRCASTSIDYPEEIHLECTQAKETEEPMDVKPLTSQDKQYSKSLPDISIVSKPEIQDGIGSVQITPGDGRGSKKMSHKEVRQMAKQLLLNSTLEASEV